MCGIVGVIKFKNSMFNITEPYINSMRDAMVHRGPDGFGTWISLDKKIGFGHRRLSIIDLSMAASQPMCNEDGSIWIVFNGEIYNHYEIRPELEKLRHSFKTDHSDTEVIIHAYEEWGIACINRFRGMFAFALWDGRERCLWLVRDRMGIKPLYFTINNERLIFASEIKAILTDSSIPRDVDEESFYHYLSFLTTPAPNTLFKDIKKLPCGSVARIDENSNLTVQRYWDLWDNINPLVNFTEKEIAERLLDELRIAVKYRKVSDVPVGVFLSGGIDSSTNAALFSENENNSVKTFSIGYLGDYTSYQNEFEYAQLMANQINAEYYEKKLTIDNVIDFFPSLVYYQDEPIADPVCIPFYYVSKLARDNGVIVCQAGEGSDELFWGYPGWKQQLMLYNMNELPVPCCIKRIGLALLKFLRKDTRYYYEMLRRASYSEPIFWGGAEAFTENEKKHLLSKQLRKKFNSYSSYEALKPIENTFYQKAWDPTPLNWMSYLDLNLRLPELLLMRVDKMSMATSLEVRVPFLDHKFVELAMAIPESIKTKNRELKYILKRAVNDIVPNVLINRKKEGFRVPINEWFSDRIGNYIKGRIVNFVNKSDFFEDAYIKTLINRNSGLKLWVIFNFVLWYERWIESNKVSR